jgi:hypothetical protein
MQRRRPVTTSVSGANLCPFSWVQVTKPPGCLGAIFGAKEESVWEPQPCIGEKCKLWDTKEGTCVFLAIGAILRGKAA